MRKGIRSKRKCCCDIMLLLCVCQIFVSATDLAYASENYKGKELGVTEIDLGDYQSEMKVGDRQLLSVTVLPETATDATVIFSTSNSKIATVNGMGRITALHIGTVEIIASCGKISEKFTLTVVPAEIVVKDIDLGDCPSEIEVGASQLLNITAIPSDATEPNITYSSNNPEIATINDIGRLTGVSVGKAEIIVKCRSVKRTFSVNVVEAKSDIVPVTNIEIADYEDELEVDKTITLSVIVFPSDATDNAVKYKSSNEGIATVNSSGEVKGISAGEVFVTVSAGDISKDVKLTVKYATSKIELNTTFIVMQEGEKFQLTARALPEMADQTIIYESRNNDIASITSSGRITAKTCGNTAIFVKNGDIITAVTVIVNARKVKELKKPKKDVREQKVKYSNVVYAKDCSVITSAMLQYFYENQETLTIYGEEYAIQVDGKRISNCDNELYTDLDFKKEEEGISFNLNGGGAVCGVIIVEIKEYVAPGGFVYLYNDSKHKYELLAQEDVHLLELDRAGRYLITRKKISNRKVNIVFFLISDFIVVAMISVYIVVKKKYWFW